MAKLRLSIVFLSLYHILYNSGVDSATFTLTNQCEYTVWPGLLSGAGTPQLSTTGFELAPGQFNSISIPPAWSGRLWGRTRCTYDSTGRFTCVTGDCGSGTLECAGGGAAPPTSLAEFTLNGAGGMDFYDVSYVDGYNLPMFLAPVGGSGGNCTTTGCFVDLNEACPSELRVISQAESVGCKSACLAFGEPQYCCSGAYATPDTCKPSVYSEYFKAACPHVYSFAYDDGTSTFTCSSADYLITFCPSVSATKKSSGPQIPGAIDVSSSGCALIYSSRQILFTFSLLIFATIWRL